jgi:hypothetical protein
MWPFKKKCQHDWKVITKETIRKPKRSNDWNVEYTYSNLNAASLEAINTFLNKDVLVVILQCTKCGALNKTIV